MNIININGKWKQHEYKETSESWLVTSNQTMIPGTSGAHRASSSWELTEIGGWKDFFGERNKPDGSTNVGGCLIDCLHWVKLLIGWLGELSDGLVRWLIGWINDGSVRWLICLFDCFDSLCGSPSCLQVWHNHQLHRKTPGTQESMCRTWEAASRSQRSEKRWGIKLFFCRWCFLVSKITTVGQKFLNN